MAEPIETLEQRIVFLCDFTKGTMPLAMLVEDDAERTEAERLLRNRPREKLISVQTQAEFEREKESRYERH